MGDATAGRHAALDAGSKVIRVAFGTTVLERGLAQSAIDGIGNYSRELLRRLDDTKGLELAPFVYSSELRNRGLIAEAVDFGPFKPQALLSLIGGRSFPIAAQRISDRLDLVHATDHLIPRLRKTPVIATLMDAIPLAHPEWVTYSFRGLKNALWRRSACWADHVVTISEHAKQELMQWFRLPEKRITVTPLGVDQRWFVTPTTSDIGRVNAEYALPERFFLFVGTLQPRKNVYQLIAAHRRLPDTVRREFPLVVVGRAGWGCNAEVAALNEGDQGALRWLRYVPDGDLVPLVSRATALVFPSLHEGFGLPVLEAFAVGIPVLSSNATSLPEVAGDSAILFDPNQSDEIAEAMKLLINDDVLAKKLRVRGRERAALFTWERTAEMTADVYRRVLGSR
jgi:alpha-1,3-rhamnosyl/mannosyltransferase